ncbi:MAG TPA: DivIVA domain-containing protein [Desulfobulbales bacterium]|nr:DivIVA domain-containing protein [Desulfobulbales bacterium]
MEITPQDIIDKEFRVKFRGFDMAEVDAFLEEVAESFFKLTEENTLLNEKVLALQEDLETLGSMAPQGQVELPAELGNILEDLKQDTSTISVELAAMKQDRQTIDSLKEKLEKFIASFQEAGAEMASQHQTEFPADLADTLEKFKQSSTAIGAELNLLKEDRQSFDLLKKNFAEIIHSAKATVSSMAAGQGHATIPADLSKALEDFKQGSKTIGADLATLKQDVGAISGMREEIKKELQEQLTAHFAGLDAKLSTISTMDASAVMKSNAPTPVPGQKGALLAAEIVEEPEGHGEDTRLPDYREEDDAAFAGDDLEFLSEDDILDVDKLRGIFQSVLDEGSSDVHDSREGDDLTADLLFLDDDDLMQDEHEPEVTFSLDENETDKKQNYGKPKSV